MRLCLQLMVRDLDLRLCQRFRLVPGFLGNGNRHPILPLDSGEGYRPLGR